MENVKYTLKIGNNKIIIHKKHRAKTQFEYYLTIYMWDSDTESIHIYEKCHLTKKGAINEAKKAISRKPRIERVY